jgi:hypothetical protein
MHRHDLSFVTDGIESALEQAGEAAGKKDVMVARGASAVRQYLAAGVTDEIDLHLVPVVPALLNDDVRLSRPAAGLESRVAGAQRRVAGEGNFPVGTSAGRRRRCAREDADAVVGLGACGWHHEGRF